MIGILSLALVAGCAGVKEAPPPVAARPVPAIVYPTREEPNRDTVASTSPRPTESEAQPGVSSTQPPAVPRQPAKTDPGTSRPDPAPTSAEGSVPSSKTSSTAKAGQVPAKVAVTAPPVGQPRNNATAPAVEKAAEPPLDVAALKARLRDTKAIGVFTKLALKNQVDDLLKQFRAHHESGQEAKVASLRQPYNLLLQKVLALIQDGDPPLARTISGSREAIWSILADREKFNSVA